MDSTISTKCDVGIVINVAAEICPFEDFTNDVLHEMLPYHCNTMRVCKRWFSIFKQDLAHGRPLIVSKNSEMITQHTHKNSVITKHILNTCERDTNGCNVYNYTIRAGVCEMRAYEILANRTPLEEHPFVFIHVVHSTDVLLNKNFFIRCEPPYEIQLPQLVEYLDDNPASPIHQFDLCGIKLLDFIKHSETHNDLWNMCNKLWQETCMD